jgi:epoxide hydrolase 4
MTETLHRTASGDDIELHYLEAGSGPPVLLLHGFPDFSRGWRHQMPVLAGAGYRVIAPDLRGYNRSGRPRSVSSYSMLHLAADVIRLMEQATPAGAAIVGHDWGGVIAWHVAARAPQLCRGLCTINAPHPDVYRRELLRNPRQLLRSWYVLLNQLPLLPEFALSARNFALLRRVLGTAENGSRIASRQELRRYEEAFAEPSALTAALNYYRAAARDLFTGRLSGPLRVASPTLIIWGEQDRYLDRRLLHGLEAHAPLLTIERVGNAGHFVHWQRPELVNQLLLEWLRRTELRGRTDAEGAASR